MPQLQQPEATPDASSAVESRPPAIDRSVIEMLRTYAPEGGPDPVAELTSTFLEDGGDRLRKINAAILNCDEVAARKAAHSLKGMSGAIGAMHLSALSNDVEHAEPGAIDRACVRQLEDEFQRVYEALRAA